MFISIKRLLEQRRNSDGGQQDLVEGLRQMGRVLLDGIATHVVPGREADLRVLRWTMKGPARRMDAPQSALDLLGISSDAVEALETYCEHTNAYQRESNEQMNSMVAMLTETVADLCGQTDASVARLQAIEKEVEHASGLEDRSALRANLQNCLVALREAAAQQRSSSAKTVQRMKDQIGKAQQHAAGANQTGISDRKIDLMPEPTDGPPESVSTAYVAVFKLQRVEQIAGRFGENVKHQMLSLISMRLKTALGPRDRLVRWKQASFVMFLNTTETAKDVRSRLLETVAAIGQQYIEVGRKSALLSVGVDWVMFPQAQYATLEAVLTDVDAFLATTRPGAPAPA